MRRIYRTRSVSEKTYQRLQGAILRQELKPGSPLVINDLATELGVSRTPVKEALLLLEREGLVESASGRISVARLRNSDIEEVFEVRQAIEIFALSKVVEEEFGPTFESLYRELSAHRFPTGDREARHASELDLRFHRALAAATRNSRLLSTWDKAATELSRFWSDGMGSLARTATDIDECLTILDALREHDRARAAEVLIRHLDQAKLALKSWQREQAARTL